MSQPLIGAALGIEFRQTSDGRAGQQAHMDRRSACHPENIRDRTTSGELHRNQYRVGAMSASAQSKFCFR